MAEKSGCFCVNGGNGGCVVPSIHALAGPGGHGQSRDTRELTGSASLSTASLLLSAELGCRQMNVCCLLLSLGFFGAKHRITLLTFLPTWQFGMVNVSKIYNIFKLKCKVDGSRLPSKAMIWEQRESTLLL